MMDRLPPWKLTPVNLAVAIMLAPVALGFTIAAILSAGPSKAFKALTGRK